MERMSTALMQWCAVDLVHFLAQAPVGGVDGHGFQTTV